MASDASTDLMVCDYCGALPAEGWLNVEVWRDDGEKDDPRWDNLHLGFCGEEHAGKYFTERPLPAPDFDGPFNDRTWKHGVSDFTFAALAVCLPLLALMGIWTIGTWIF